MKSKGKRLERYREEVINIRIADVLRGMGFQATGETISKGKLPDVIVTVDGLKINIEGRFESSAQISKLKNKCKERIEEGICTIAIGIVYPDSLRGARSNAHLIKKIKKCNYEACFIRMTAKGMKELNFASVRIEELASELNHLYGIVIADDILKEQVEKVSSAISMASEVASTSNLFFESDVIVGKLEEILGITRQEKKSKIPKKSKERKSKTEKFQKDVLQIGFFIIFDALVFHEVLSGIISQINSLRKIKNTRILAFLEQEWIRIMEINYLPIFELAQNVCTNLPSAPEIEHILKILCETTLDVIGSGVLLKHDLMGRIYHKLLLKTTGKYYATYYTSIPAATLLSDLTIKTANPDCKQDFTKLNVLEDYITLDPACGSGTLLSGLYGALKDKYILDRYNSDSPKKLNLKIFHKLMLENVLCGWDVLDYAGHLTLTTLALHNTKATFKDSNIYTLQLGAIKNEIHLGSLDFLDPEIPLIGKGYKSYARRKKLAGDREEEIKVTQNSVNIVIMNPPFSRSAGAVNVKFGYESEKIKNKMTNQLKKLGKKLGYTGVGQAGLGAYFIILANMLLKGHGRLALVIPRAILSGVSWRKIREDLFLKQYEIEYIISNYDPGDKEQGIEPWNFSEKTDLGEVLVVARKSKISHKSKYTTFVNIWNKPPNELVSVKIAASAMKRRYQKNLNYLEGESYETIKLNEKDIGTLYNVPSAFLEYNFLVPCLFAHPELNKLTFSLVQNKLMKLIPLGILSKKLGMDRKQVEGYYKLVKHRTSYPVLWGHPLSIDTISRSEYDYTKPTNVKAENKYNTTVSNLLVAETIWTKTLSIVSIYSQKPLMATMFWEVDVDDESAKILSLWFNSTLGLLTLLSRSINNKGIKFNLKKNQLREVPVLDVRLLSKSDKRKLVDLFNNIKNNPFKRIPEEFKLASKGQGVRKRIDDLFHGILNLEVDLSRYYVLLAKDPIITNVRI